MSILRNRIDLKRVPFTERGSRMMLFCDGEQFSLKLAERWPSREPEFGHWRKRIPFIRDLVLTNGRGEPLSFEVTTDAHVVRLHTEIGAFHWAFMDEETLWLALPAVRCGVRFIVQARNGYTDRRGGEFKGSPSQGDNPRQFAYTTRGRILTNQIQPCAGAAHALPCSEVTLLCEPGHDQGVGFNITPQLAFNRTIPSTTEVVRNAQQRWRAWFDAAPPMSTDLRDVRDPSGLLQTQFAYAWWCLGAGLVSPRLFTTRTSLMPSKTWYVGMWQWDQCFHALAYRHSQVALAEDQLRVMLDHQRADGMLPDAVHDEGVVFDFLNPLNGQLTPVTKPPLMAWAALKVYESAGRLDFLAEVYKPIARNTEWWFTQDDDHDGVVQYNHPYSSGLDDSPLWDAGMPIESPDINTYLVMQLDGLARMAEILGAHDDAATWSRRAGDLLRKTIAHFWDADAGLFWATKDHQPIRVTTLFNLYPLLTGRLPAAMNERLVQHLRSPKEFWTAYPLPTVSVGDPTFDATVMWRGPTWANINYLFIEGLTRCGYHDLAHELRERTLALVSLHGDIYEYYNPLTGEPPPKAAGIFGWTSAVFVDLLTPAMGD